MKITPPDHLDLHRQFGAREGGVGLAGEAARRLLGLIIDDNQQINVTLWTLLAARVRAKKIDGASRYALSDGFHRLTERGLDRAAEANCLGRLLLQGECLNPEMQPDLGKRPLRAKKRKSFPLRMPVEVVVEVGS